MSRPPNTIITFPAFAQAYGPEFTPAEAAQMAEIIAATAKPDEVAAVGVEIRFQPDPRKFVGVMIDSAALGFAKNGMEPRRVQKIIAGRLAIAEAWWRGHIETARLELKRQQSQQGQGAGE
jgi:hypothetical protein